MVPKYLTLTSYNNSFQEIGTCFWQKLTVWQGKFVLSKKHLKMAYFCVHESGLPNFGRLWTPNPWHQANFSGTPEILRVWRFKWAMWKVGGIKIERTLLWYFFPRPCTKISEKWFFLVKRSLLQNFQGAKFFMATTHQILVRTQDSVNVFGLGDWAFVLKLLRHTRYTCGSQPVVLLSDFIFANLSSEED